MTEEETGPGFLRVVFIKWSSVEFLSLSVLSHGSPQEKNPTENRFSVFCNLFAVVISIYLSIYLLGLCDMTIYVYRMDEIKSLSFHIMFYRLFRGVAKYIVYGTFSSFG